VEDLVDGMRGQLSGGISLEDDYPRGAYVLLRVTRPLTPREGRTLHRAARRLRIRHVRHSEEFLENRQDAIDFTRARKEGVVIWGAEVDNDRSAVDVTYSSDRVDAEAVLRRLYRGPLLFTRVPASTPGCSDPTSYRLDADGRTLHLRWGTSGSATNHRVEVKELPDRILVGGVDDFPPIITLDLVYREATVTLAASLGTRSVLSAETHKTVPRRDEPPKR
jgi:hypothetical protein